MKGFFTKAKIYWLAVVCIGLFSANSVYATALSGPYTIGSSGTYTSFSDAVSALTTNGVSGAVVFKVAAGTYSEQVSIGSITGASATNTITFQGQSDSSKVILTSASSSSATTNYTLQLSGSRYVIFKDITISRTGTAAYSIDVYLSTTAYCQFQSCLLITKQDPSQASPGIVAGNPVLYSIGIDTGNVFNLNHVKYGYNGICFGSAGYNNTVSNCIFDSSGLCGVYCNAAYEVNLLVSGNTFNMGTATSGSNTTLYSYGFRCDAISSFKCVKNRFYSNSSAGTCRCLAVFSVTTNAGVRNLIANNFMWVSAGTSASTGITLGGATNTDIVYNNVLMTGTPSTPGSGLFVYTQYPASGIVVKDNNFVNKGGGYCIENENDSTASTYSTGIAIEDYNNLYTTGSYVAGYRGAKYSSLSAYQSALTMAGAEAHSISADPGYKSDYDLHESSGSVYQAGTPITGVTTDIDGNTRSTLTPCIGACEFIPVLIDAGITVLDSPTTYCYPVKRDVVVQFTNFGLSKLTAATIGWSVNGTVQTPVSWIGSLVSATQSAQINLGTFAFNDKTPYVLKIWTAKPNLSTDQNNDNDTLVETVASGLSGTYYLGGTSPDFTSFNNALSAITEYGVCGPTEIRVRNGTYSEQLSIPNYTEVTAASPITFVADAGDSSKVILTQPSTGSSGLNNATLQLNGTKWFNFKQMTIQKTGSNIYEQVVELKGGASHNSFQDCRLIGIPSASGTTADVVISDSSTSTTESSNSFINNAIKYGFYGLNLAGQWASHGTGIVISNNNIDSTYATSIMAANEDGIKISGNHISDVLGGVSYSGIQLMRCNNGDSITSNNVQMPYGGYAGIYLLYSNATSASTGIVANNYVSINSTSSPRGIFDSTSVYQNFYYNTVDLYGTNTGTCLYLNAASGKMNFENNLLYNAGGGYTIKVPVASSVSASDYNNFYTTGSNMGLWGTTGCAALSNWKTASSMGANSSAIAPGFLSNTDYRTLNQSLVGTGTPVSGITTDIEGSVRDATHPSLSCYDVLHIPANEAGVSAILNPTGAKICGGPTTVMATLNNYGIDTLKSVTIGWSVNGTAQTAYSFIGKINPSSSAKVTIGTYNFTAGTAIVKAYSSQPNGVLDSFPDDDSVTSSYNVSPAPAANTGTASSVCAGLSVNLGTTSVAGDSYAWSTAPSDATISSDTVSNPSATPSATTKYSLTETIKATGCSLTNSVTITVHALPAANAGTTSGICAGSTTNIGAAAVSGSTYSWTSSPSGFSSTDANPTVTPSAATSYTLTEKDINGCVNSNSVTITPVSPPAAYTGPANSVCSGSSLQIGGTAVAGNTYSWTSIPTGFTSTLSNPVASPTATTTYYLTESVSSGCSRTDSVLITMMPTPKANAGTSKAVCAGTSTSIGFKAVSGSSYSWKSIPSGFASSSASASVTPSVSTTYILTESNTTTGCFATNSVLITVNQLPAAYAGSSASLCSNSATTTIGGTSISGNTYSWSPSTGLGSSTASNPSVTLSGTTTYKLTETTTATGCSNSNSVTLTLNQSPAANAGVSSSICAGQSAIIGSSSVSGDAYSWSNSSTLSSSSSSSPKASPTNTTTYSLTETVSATGCANTNSVTVTVNPLPSANVGASSQVSLCSGQSTVIGATAVSGSLYSWSSTPTGLSSSNSSINVSPKDTTVYTLTESNASTGCSAKNNVTVNIIRLPVAKISTEPICAGNTGIIVVSNAVAGDSYKWYLNGSLLAKDTNFQAFSNAGGDYTSLITHPATGCSALSNVATLVVNPLPKTLVKTLEATTQCDGDSVVIVATLDTNDSYQWSRNGDTISGAHSYTYAAKQSGIYQVMITTPSQCSDTSVSIPVTINPVPKVSFNVPGRTTVCDGQTVLMESAPQTGVSFSWYQNGNLIPGADSLAYKATTSGMYNLKLTYGTGCSSMSSMVSVTVNALPASNVSALSTTNLCPGTSVTLVTDADPTYTYRWQSHSNGYIAGETRDTFTATQPDGYSVTVTDGQGCVSNSNETMVTAALYPKVSIIRPAKTNVCQDTVLLATMDTDVASYQWWMNGNPIPNATTNTLKVGQTGFYTVMVKGTVTCTNMDTIGITENAQPMAGFVVPSDTVCNGHGLLFINQSNIASSDKLSYIWTFGDKDTSFGQDPTHTYAAPGRYNVRVSATAPTGCTATATDSVEVLPLSSSKFTVIPEGYRRLGFKATDNSGTNYLWSFGDSTYGYGDSSYHEYASSGTYKVTLVVTNANGCISTTTTSETITLTGIDQVSSENLSIDIFPNPFETQTNVLYSLKHNSSVQIDVFDINGRGVAHVDNSLQPAGDHSYIFKETEPGTYFIKMIVDGQQYVSRVIEQQ